MAVLDEKGRLFGRVNVIDALVVLLVLAVVAAGVALVGAGGETPAPQANEPEQYATFVLADQPSWLGSQVSAGDNLTVAGSENDLRVTDVFATPTATNDTQLVVRVGYDAPPETKSGQLRVGDGVTVTGPGYRSDATVAAVNGSAPELRTAATSVALSARVDPATAERIRAGDAYRLGNHAVATVDSVTALPTGDGDRQRLQLGATLETIELGGHRLFAGKRLQTGAQIPLATNATAPVRTTVTNVGSAEPPGEPVNVTVTVAWENVRPTVADQVARGDVESHRGATARVTGLTSSPATVYATNDSGQVVASEHPRNRDVTLTVTATARRVGSDLLFHDRSLQTGRDVTLSFDTVTVHGTVLDVQTDE